MPAGQPGASSRGRGGKFKKYTRGGGKQFSRDLQPVDSEGNAVSMWSQQARQRSPNKEESSEEEEEEEEEDDDDEAGPSSTVNAEATREARKAQKKARKEAAIAKSKARNVEVGDLPSSEEEDSDEDEDDDDDDGMPANPNYSAAARKQTAPVSAAVDDITEGVRKMPGNRREREAAEAAAAKERYMRLSAQGKTDTAKADLARLKLIREQRETEAARRQAEKEEREEQEAKKKAEIEAREAKRREAAMGPQKSKKK